MTNTFIQVNNNNKINWYLYSAIGPLIGGMVEDAGLEAASWQRLQSIVVATMAIFLSGHAPGSDTPAWSVWTLADPSMGSGWTSSRRRHGGQSLRPMRFSRPAVTNAKSGDRSTATKRMRHWPQKNVQPFSSLIQLDITDHISSAFLFS